MHGLYALPEDPWPKRAVVYALERVAAACSDAELVQNPEDVDVLRAAAASRERKLHLLGNGIDLARFDPDRVDPARVAASSAASLGAGPDDVVCGVVGRLVWEKGYREVFDAAARLRDARPARARRRRRPDRRRRRATRSPPTTSRRAERDGGSASSACATTSRTLYAAMDLYVLASYREGFPRSAMEAAAMGVPVVVTDIRGCRQVVDDGVTGVLVPARDAGRARRRDRVARGRRRRRARRWARPPGEKARREFDEQTVIDITLGVYEQLLGARAPVGRRA